MSSNLCNKSKDLSNNLSKAHYVDVKRGADQQQILVNGPPLDDGEINSSLRERTNINHAGIQNVLGSFKQIMSF